MRFSIIATSLALAICSTARAEPVATAEQRSLESFGETDKACREWSDACAVCLRRDDGTAACSLPGIACEPTAITCRSVLKANGPAKP